jgi:hypothetical protein
VPERKPAGHLLRACELGGFPPPGAAPLRTSFRRRIFGTAENRKKKGGAPLENKHICLLNDSFPPQRDSVANTVVNYAAILHKTDTQIRLLNLHYLSK